MNLELSSVQRLEDYLLKLPQADIRTFHSFPKGKYERKIVIPPETVLTGAVHKTDYSVRVEEGCIAVNTDEGVKLLTAPHEFEAKAGIKRAGYTLDETVWVDIYDNPDDCRDLSVIEERLYVIPDCGLGANRLLEADRCDYQLFLQQVGLTQAQMDAIVHSDDLIPMDAECEVRDSLIHGNGLFALRDFEAGEIICPGRLAGHRTPAGRFINHSVRPNAEPLKVEDDIYARALRSIKRDEEILIDYRVSMRVNFGVLICQAG